MTIESIASRNLSGGVSNLFTYVNDTSDGLFAILLLFFLWFVFTIGSFMIQLNSGKRESVFPVSLAVGSFITSIIATIMRLWNNFLPDIAVGVVWILTVISVLYLFFSSKD